MSASDAVRTQLEDSFGRLHELVGGLTDGLSREQSAYRPDPEANSIAWLLWHATRVQDDHIAELAGAEQVWPQWRSRFGLPFDPWDTGFGHSSEQVGQVQAEASDLAGYHADVHRLSLDYVRSLNADDLAVIVDERWDPPVSASARLVSVIGELNQHLGQAAYVRGLAERAGIP